MLKKNYDDVMSGNCEVIVIIPIYGQSGATQKLDSERIVRKTYIFVMFQLFVSGVNQENEERK